MEFYAGKSFHKLVALHYRFSSKWETRQDIFEGYEFKILGKTHGNCSVIASNLSEDTIEISNLPSNMEMAGLSFEITANEEAPILAARLATSIAIGKPLPEIEMKLGSTKGTNALLEKKRR